MLVFLSNSLYTKGMKNTTLFFYMIFALVVVLSVSCHTVKDIPEDLSAEQLIQLGQNAYGSANYKNAERYYKTVIVRYGADTSIYVEARYELGHLYIKQRKYDEAYASFKEILDIYATATPGTLPGAYNKLAQLEMAKIPADKLPKTEATEIQPASEEAQDFEEEMEIMTEQ